MVIEKKIPTFGKEFHRIEEGDHAVQIIVSGSDCATVAFDRCDHLLGRMLYLDVHTTLKTVQTLVGEVHTVAVVVRIQMVMVGGAERR